MSEIENEISDESNNIENISQGVQLKESKKKRKYDDEFTSDEEIENETNILYKPIFFNNDLQLSKMFDLNYAFLYNDKMQTDKALLNAYNNIVKMERFNSKLKYKSNIKDLKINNLYHEINIKNIQLNNSLITIVIIIMSFMLYCLKNEINDFILRIYNF